MRSQSLNAYLALALCVLGCHLAVARRVAVAQELPSGESSRPDARGEPLPNRDAVAAWLKTYAVRLVSVRPAVGSADLQPLKGVLRGVRVVGLGEATHNTREFSQVKHRLLEFLVRELGYDVFAIEANYATCVEINDYVMGGNIPRSAILEDLFDIWRSEEVLSLIEWVREYNRTMPQGKRVRFYGFDIQEVLQSRSVVYDYLKRVGAPAERLSRTKALISKLWGAQAAAPAYGAGPVLSSLLPEFRELLGYFTTNEAAFVRKTSRAEYEQALHHLRLLFQNADSFIADDDKRSRYMAENILHILNRERPGARVVVWAHNVHVSTGEYYVRGRGHSMGHYLRRALGQDYYAFGFAFGLGSFAAFAGTYKQSGGDDLRERVVGPPPANSLDWYLAAPGLENYVIDFRHAPRSEAVERWLSARQGMRQAGGDKVPADIGELWESGRELFPVNLGNDYDGLIFVGHISSAGQLKPVGAQRGGPDHK